MRKGRRQKVVWLPVDLNNRLGRAPLVASSSVTSSTIIKIYTANPLGATPTTEEIPIVKDFSGAPAVGPADADASLADIESSGYRLRRIVGKLGFSVLQGAATLNGDGSIFHITAGFIIRRVGDDGTSYAATAGVTAFNNISTANIANVMDPWIWRRSWDLADRGAAALALDPNVEAFGRSNTLAYGSGIFDGPHVDAKTARIVGPEERLFLDVTIEGINGDSQGAPGAVLLLGDLRVLGSLRTNSGNRRNASR